MYQTDLSDRRSALVAGTLMAYRDVGRGDAVLLAHGYLWDANMWQSQIEVLSSRYRVIVPELWGHGASGALPVGSSDLRDIAVHHLSLLDGLGIENVSLIGHSVGGMWGAELALMAPERVKSLVLIDSYLGSEPDDQRQAYFSMLSAVQSAMSVPEAIIEAMLPLYFAPETILKNSGLKNSGLIHAFRERLRNVNTSNLIDTLLPFGRMIFARRNAMPDVRQLSLPSLVMSGEHSRARPVAEGREMAEALNCLFIELSGAGHSAPLETPEEVNRHLLAFLAHTSRTPATVAR